LLLRRRELLEVTSLAKKDEHKLQVNWRYVLKHCI